MPAVDRHIIGGDCVFVCAFERTQLVPIYVHHMKFIHLYLRRRRRHCRHRCAHLLLSQLLWQNSIGAGWVLAVCAHGRLAIIKRKRSTLQSTPSTEALSVFYSLSVNPRGPCHFEINDFLIWLSIKVGMCVPERARERELFVWVKNSALDTWAIQYRFAQCALENFPAGCVRIGDAFASGTDRYSGHGTRDPVLAVVLAVGARGICIERYSRIYSFSPLDQNWFSRFSSHAFEFFSRQWMRILFLLF